jgi:hypothetical protein
MTITFFAVPACLIGMPSPPSLIELPGQWTSPARRLMISQTLASARLRKHAFADRMEYGERPARLWEVCDDASGD